MKNEIFVPVVSKKATQLIPEDKKELQKEVLKCSDGMK